MSSGMALFQDSYIAGHRILKILIYFITMTWKDLCTLAEVSQCYPVGNLFFENAIFGVLYFYKL